MAILNEEIEDFAAFARQHSKDAGSLDELYDRWRQQSYCDVDARAVEVSLRDMLAGDTGRPFNEFATEFRKRNKIQSEQ